MLKLMKIVKVEGVTKFYLPTVISTIFILIQATVSRKGNVWVCFTAVIFESCGEFNRCGPGSNRFLFNHVVDRVNCFQNPNQAGV